MSRQDVTCRFVHNPKERFVSLASRSREMCKITSSRNSVELRRSYRCVPSLDVYKDTDLIPSSPSHGVLSSRHNDVFERARKLLPVDLSTIRTGSPDHRYFCAR